MNVPHHSLLTGRCIDLVGAALPYFPLVEALRPLRGTSVLDGLEELSRLLPGSPLAAITLTGRPILRLAGGFSTTN